MIIRQAPSDFKTIGYYIGIMIRGFAFLLLVPLIVALCNLEFSEAINFIISFAASIIVAYLFLLICQEPEELSFRSGMVIVSLSWIVAMFLGAIPLYLSGHFCSYLDACFDSMSGLATVGLSILQDLDHTSISINMWRFLVPYICGQGIAVITIIFLARTAGVYGMYTGEGREERILPNITQTAGIIWKVSLIYLVVGVSILSLLGIKSGLPPSYSFWHGMWLYMSAWATCGFAPQSTSVLFYHSLWIELGTTIALVLGSINFSLHYALWSGKRLELFRDIEIQSFLITFATIFSILCLALIKEGVYPDFFSFFSKAIYHSLSAHATAGFSTIYSSQFIDWGELGMLALIIGMWIGGCAGSTAGGVKCLRMGIFFSDFMQYIKQIGFPSTVVFQHKFRHIQDVIVKDRMVRQATLIFLSFLFTYLLGAIIGVIYGYPFVHALFESVSTASGTGLSVGITSKDMPGLMKIVYIFEMWAGRLEFISIFAILNLIITRGKR
ncbi:MAG: potassium transporter TrkG [Candidatus Desantisbacteria bacterium]